MPNVSSNNSNDNKNSSSGHGALGMGGQPSEDPRDLERGGDGRVNSDETGKTAGPVPGAFGNATVDATGGGTGGSQAVGVMGDKDATQDVDNAIRKSKEGDRAS